MGPISNEAREWWHSLPDNIKTAIVLKHLPNREFYIVDSESPVIEKLYILERKTDENDSKKSE